MLNIKQGGYALTWNDALLNGYALVWNINNIK